MLSAYNDKKLQPNHNNTTTTKPKPKLTNPMKLIFQIRAEAFRVGADVSEPIVSIDVDLNTLASHDRIMINERLKDGHVCALSWSKELRFHNPSLSGDGYDHIRASAPTLAALIDAVNENRNFLREREFIELI